MKENTEKYKYQKALNYVKSSINRLNNSTKCIKKLKIGKCKQYLVRSLMEAKLLIEFCIEQHILNELVIYNQFNQRIKYSQYTEETEDLVNHPHNYRAYIRVWKGFITKIDKTKPINEQRIVYLENWL
jgi:hypothetical protein